MVWIQLTKSVTIAFSNFAMFCASSLGGSGLAAVPPALPLVLFCPYAPLVFGPASIRPAGGECGELCSSSDSGVGVHLVNGVGALRWVFVVLITAAGSSSYSLSGTELYRDAS